MTRIEDYAIVGDCHTAALVGNDGSIDWLCLPRFDSAPCFASLLGAPEHGYFRIAPRGGARATRRRYRRGTLVLETDFETPDGAVTLIDAMLPREGSGPQVVRVVEGRRGRVPMEMTLVLRFDWGSIVPWVRTIDGALRATAGPEAVRLVTPAAVRGEGLTSVAEMQVAEGERVPFSLTWHRSWEAPPHPIDPLAALDAVTSWWRAWSDRCAVDGPWADAIQRSLITLKALADPRTGGIVAAPTTSLPEEIGGVRNWDYRFCWVRDATFTLLALLDGGYVEEATAWREWLLRAVAGSPGELQIMYGLGGERRLTEASIPWLCGYEGSAPVRVGNAASAQRQLDVYGELMDCLYNCQKHGVPAEDAAWRMQLALMEALESAWCAPDNGIWEVRGPPRHFTHSKIMAWVAFDRAVKTVESFGADGPVARWRAMRARLRAEIVREGFDAQRCAFTQSYGSKDLDAALLLIPHVGFLPATDARVVGTVEAIRRELVMDGFVMRYATHGSVDGVEGREGAFLPCTLWLADCLALQGKTSLAREILERVLAVRNDVGLLSEEYDPGARRLLGNFPQAFSHVALLHTAIHLSEGQSASVITRAT